MVSSDDRRSSSPAARKFQLLPEAIAWRLLERTRDRFGQETLQRHAAGGIAPRELLFQLLDQAVHQENLTLSRSDRQALQSLLESEVLGYGPLDSLLADPTVSEIMVNGPARVYVERQGRLEETAVAFRDRDHMMRIIERILSPLGRRVDESSPMIDARLPDGSRVNVIIPPLSLVGPVLTIRKFEREAFTMEDMVRLGTLTPQAAAFLAACVRGRLNIIVAGGAATGKTTLLNVLSSFIPEGERIVTIENAAELQLRQRHVVSIESRPPNIEGQGEVSIRDLVINALRMRPDRIVVGEVRGGEALDMLQAMNTGHEGSMTTLHANDPAESLLRLQTMVLLAGTELPAWAILEQIGEAIQLIVHMDRASDGSRYVSSVVEVGEREEERIELRPLYGYDEERRRLEPTGTVPRFLDRLAERGVLVPPALFDPRTAGSPEQERFLEQWLRRTREVAGPPGLPGRLDWPLRYRLTGQAQSWLVQQIGPDTALAHDEQSSALLARGLDEVLRQENLTLSRSDRQALQSLLESEVLGYGPLDSLLADPTVSEIMVNGPARVYVERQGRLEETAVAFRDRDHMMRIIERILSPLGRRVDESSPMIDARLPDGSRVNVIIPPLSLVGPVLTIRKFEREAFTMEDMVRLGTLTPQAAAFLAACVRGRLNIIVAGGAATGKTTLLNVLSSFIPEGERIVTIENAAELQLRQRHVVSIESRPPNIEGQGEVSIRDLVINALRMRPDRIVVGEVRGGEALDMLQTMSTGASLTTLHANDPREALLRLETMVMLAGFDLPVRAIREQIALSIDLFVHLRRMPDGSRKVVDVAEVTGLRGREIVLHDVYSLQSEVQGDQIVDRLEPSGSAPRVLEKLRRRGVAAEDGWFARPQG